MSLNHNYDLEIPCHNEIAQPGQAQPLDKNNMRLSLPVNTLRPPQALSLATAPSPTALLPPPPTSPHANDANRNPTCRAHPNRFRLHALKVSVQWKHARHNVLVVQLPLGALAAPGGWHSGQGARGSWRVQEDVILVRREPRVPCTPRKAAGVGGQGGNHGGRGRGCGCAAGGGGGGPRR